MSRLAGWLEDTSDWLSPIVVKEVRQTVRGRDFHYSFAAGLLVGLAVAFYGAAMATIQSDATIGAGTFTALMTCLSIFGMLVVPIAAFSAMRAERMEQTIELVTVTALSPRRVVIGKLMAQAVKLVTLFAALAPFMTMSFLLGGIDFVTILISLGTLFVWSLWAASAFLFLSTLFKSRAMSGAVFGVLAIVLLVFAMSLGRMAVFGVGGTVYGGSPAGSANYWWALAMMVTGCLVTMMNLVLLAENRLAVTTGNRVTALRIGFFVQFMLIVAWTLATIASPIGSRAGAAEALTVLGGLHLAIVAAFTVTEDLGLPRRVLLEMQQPSRWNWLLTLLRPGGGRGAAYVLVQMALLVGVAQLLDPSLTAWRLAMCGYICFFTGVPAYVWRRLRPRAEAAFELRVAVLVAVAASVVLPDVIYYIVWQPQVFESDYGSRHLINPFRTLSLPNWVTVQSTGRVIVAALIGVIGLLAYVGLIRLGRQAPADERVTERAVAVD